MTNFEEIQRLKSEFLIQVENSFSGIISLWDELLLSLFLLLFGWFLGEIIEKLFIKISNKKWVQSFSERIGFTNALQKAGIKESFGEVLGSFVKGYIFTLFILSVSKILGITAISDFLQDFLLYVPRLIVAFIIILFGVQISNTTYSLISSGFKLIDSSSGKILAGVFKGIIITFSILAALVYLEIQPFLVNVLFIGFVTMIVLAGGLAFGLGGKSTVEKFLEDIRKEKEEEEKL